MTLVLAAAAVLELCIGQAGLALPVTLAAAFYLAVAYAWQRSALLSLSACAILDIGFGRTWPCTIPALAPLLLGASIWRMRGNTREPLTQIVPGVFIGVFAAVSQLFYAEIHRMAAGLPPTTPDSTLFSHNIFGAVFIMPLLTAFLDACAKRLGLRRYAAIHQRHDPQEQ